ncbi:MAG: leukotoxin LktA family filamentous adhesin, partial [Stenotrophomonas sp.]
MNRIDAIRESSANLLNGEPQAHRLRPAGLAAAIGSVLAMSVSVGASAGDAGSSVVADGAKTVVSSDGANSWKVTTTDIKNGPKGGRVAFNSFTDFGVELGQTVNLILPKEGGNQVNNLVNLVSNSQIYINGTLNSLLGEGGVVGGRVFFVDPMGMVVGKSGVLNVGSLTVATPTSKVMDDILAGGGSLNRLMTGTLTPEQISAEGAVSIAGRINARNGVRVQARAIDVTGTILVEVPAGETLNGAFNLQRDDVAVNTGGDDTKIVLVDDGNGQIQLRAAAIVDTGLALSKDATATVTIGCEAGQPDCDTSKRASLIASDIELTAVAKVDSSYKNPDNTPDGILQNVQDSLVDISAAGDLLQTAAELGAEKALGGQIAFLRANSTARVVVNGNADLTANVAAGKNGNIALYASTVQLIDNSAAGKAYEKKDVPVLDDQGNPVNNPDGTPKTQPETHYLSLGATYAQINATTDAIIRSGAGVKADGAVSVKADADTQLKVAAQS